jgi:AcrR family transcriptional regulator
MSPRRAKAIAGRVGDDPAAALRELLIDAAERLLAQAQISAITTRDIARAAGESDGVLYNYFPGKTDLLLAALLRRYEGILARFESGLPKAGEGTVEGNLAAFARAGLVLQADAFPSLAGLMTEPVLLHRLLDEIHRQPFGPQITEERLTEYLRAEQRLGRIPEDVDATAATSLLMGAILLLALTGHMTQTAAREGLAGQIHPIVAALIRGLA